MKVYNTLTKKIEPFVPNHGKEVNCIHVDQLFMTMLILVIYAHIYLKMF